MAVNHRVLPGKQQRRLSPCAQPVAVKTLARLRSAEARCRRCPLYRVATQVVPGEGPLRARLMLVGEQPGDSEDKTGKPFMGPAGRMLDRALAEAQIARGDLFITNAVKHFKFEMRGKRRLHKRPDAFEVAQCKTWLDGELQIVQPGAVVALGATAARSLPGKAVTISAARARTYRLEDGTLLLVTIHPSFLLRLRDDAEKARQFRAFVTDLRRANALAARPAGSSGR